MVPTKRRRLKRERPKRRLDTVSAAFERHQPLISSVSVLISAVGLVIAGSSSWLAWKQVSIMNSERHTPYKAALYTERISSLRETTKAIADFELSFTCIDVINTEDLAYNGPNMNGRRACMKEISGTSRQLYAATIPTITQWGDKTRQLILDYIGSSGHLSACTNKWLLVGNHHIKNDPFPDSCKLPYNYRNELKFTHDIGSAAMKSMIDDMRKLSD